MKNCFFPIALFFFVPVFGFQEASMPKKTLVRIPVIDKGVEGLKEREKRQLQTVKQFKVDHGFRFVNRLKESGISFIHQVTDDNLKDFKAVHYDHSNGLTVADVDSDGLYDIYFMTQVGANELWKNLGGGKFSNITARAGVAMSDRISVSGSFADVDNDGDADLFVTTVRMGNVMFLNDGKGNFEDVTDKLGLGYSGHSSGSVFFDYDRDGLLDLYLTNVGNYTLDIRGRAGYYVGRKDAFSGHLFPERTEYSILYRNLGGGKMKDISKQAGLLDGGWAGDATFCDLNLDGYPDLYVLNMQGDDHYYENQNGERFIDKTSQFFPKTSWGAMSAKFFDYNNDGLMDLFVTDMHSDMSELIGPEKEKLKANMKFPVGQKEEGKNNLFGNSFYKNLGDGRFEEISDQIGVENYWPWGVSAGDFNADGYEDLFIASSMSFPYHYGINSLLLNNKGTEFLDSEFIVGIEPRDDGQTHLPWLVMKCSGVDRNHFFCQGKQGDVEVWGTIGTRAAAVFDLDDDGDLDIVTHDFGTVPLVLINDLAQRKSIHYLKVRLVGSKSNRDGFGAVVAVHAGGQTYTKIHDGKSGYLSQSSLPIYFGLGSATKIDRIEVRWPSGQSQTINEKIPVNDLLVIREPKGT